MSMRADTGVGIEEPVAALDRHERRRGRGLPVVSVLAGRAGLALQRARAWAEGRGRSIVRITAPDPDAATVAWADRLAAERDLAADAVEWLARRLGRIGSDLGARLGRMTPFEREAFLDDALADAAGTGLEVVGRRLLAGPPGPPAALAADLAGSLEAGGFPRRRLATVLLELVPPATTPVMLLLAGVAEGQPLAQLAELAAGLVQDEPGLAILLVADAEDLDAYLVRGPESRARALLRESVVPVPALDGAALRRRLDGLRPGLAEELDGPVQRLGADGASEELADLFGAAALAACDREGGGPGDDDRARSAAERFLFERLESLPETAGLFRLNARPGAAPGSGRPLEVDLLAEASRLAIEVDGYYHFRDAEAYRRDRRKDLELQRRGYLVVRVLADDVVRRLETILETILDAVAHQARPAPRS